MKKLIFPLVLLFSTAIFAQEEETVFKRDTARNELSIGALNLVVFGVLDIAYERVLSNNTSWAVEGFIQAFNRDNEDPSKLYSRKSSLTGKYKYFFGEGPATGFYVNGLAMISNGEYDVFLYDDGDYLREVSRDYTDLALGFGLGAKFVAKQGFFLDLGAGIGRNLLNPDSPTIVGQININLGMRF